MAYRSRRHCLLVKICIIFVSSGLILCKRSYVGSPQVTAAILSLTCKLPASFMNLCCVIMSATGWTRNKRSVDRSIREIGNSCVPIAINESTATRRFLFRQLYLPSVVFCSAVHIQLFARPTSEVPPL